MMLLYFVIIYAAAILGWVLFKYISPSFLKSLVYLFTIASIVETVAFILRGNAHHARFSNLIYNLVSFVEIPIWYYLFYRINKGNIFSRLIPLVAFVILGYSFLESAFIKSWYVLHTDALRLHSVFIILLSISYLYRSLSIEYHNIFSDSFFYIVSACILYHGVLFVNLTTLAENRYWGNREVAEAFFLFQVVANYVYYILLCCSIIICYYNQRLKPAVSYLDL